MTSRIQHPINLDQLLIYRLDHRKRRKFCKNSMQTAYGIFDIIRPFYDPKECPSSFLHALLNNPEMWLNRNECTAILHTITGAWLDLKKTGQTRIDTRSRATIWILVLLGRATGLWSSSTIQQEHSYQTEGCGCPGSTPGNCCFTRQVVSKTWYRVVFKMNTIKKCQKSVVELLAIRKFRRCEMGLLGVLDTSIIQNVARLIWSSRYEFLWFRSVS